ncbi:hypothetical protein BCR37DRAFT_277146 [Protomyces lactucae-debilis]|uniref:Uncharacterized protein n=1 Tax=Protomyces lactucae-debilis TaxID=2754530 RepID=A0A1Y2FIG4_PROLT|nr:uncharacterized protein BCR37DRAFT_277146 [Protomyces lactucae-debilis]ORY83731.1 hypothetical protein BCR37DRAFT_277146 [Protomyces lactucae-debilis]
MHCAQDISDLSTCHPFPAHHSPYSFTHLTMRVSITLRLLFTLLITFIAVGSAAGGFSKKLKKLWGSKSRPENFEHGESSNTIVESASPGDPTFGEALETGKCYQAKIRLVRSASILESQIHCDNLCRIHAHAFVAIYKSKDEADVPHSFCNRGYAHFSYDSFCQNSGYVNATEGKGPYSNVKAVLVNMLNEYGKYGRLDADSPRFTAFFRQFASGFSLEDAWLGSMVEEFTAFESYPSNEKGTEDEELQTCRCGIWATFTRVPHRPGSKHMCDLPQFSSFISRISSGWTLAYEQTSGTYGETAVPKRLSRHFEQFEGMPEEASEWFITRPAIPVDQPGFDCIQTLRDEHWKQAPTGDTFIETLQPEHSNTLQQDQAPHGCPPKPYW